jgi:hypothetical protein
MNLHHVQRDETWKKAPKGARSGFIERMRDCDYDAQSTKDAWDWYLMGWKDACTSATDGPSHP